MLTDSTKKGSSEGRDRDERGTSAANQPTLPAATPTPRYANPFTLPSLEDVPPPVTRMSATSLIGPLTLNSSSRDLSSHLKAVRNVEEEVGHIGWYMSEKYKRVRQQFATHAQLRTDIQIAAEESKLAEERDKMKQAAKDKSNVDGEPKQGSGAANNGNVHGNLHINERDFISPNSSEPSKVSASSMSLNSAFAVAASSASAPSPSLLLSAFSFPTSNACIGRSQFFAGVVAWVDGLTDPSADVLRMLLYAHGGALENILQTGVTHWIANNLTRSKLSQMQSHTKHKPIVHPNWIVESVKAGKRLPEKDFMLVQRKDATTLPFAKLATSVDVASPIPALESASSKIAIADPAVTNTSLPSTILLSSNVTGTSFFSPPSPLSVAPTPIPSSLSPFAAPSSSVSSSSRKSLGSNMAGRRRRLARMELESQLLAEEMQRAAQDEASGRAISFALLSEDVKPASIEQAATTASTTAASVSAPGTRRSDSERLLKSPVASVGVKPEIAVTPSTVSDLGPQISTTSSPGPDSANTDNHTNIDDRNSKLALNVESANTSNNTIEYYLDDPNPLVYDAVEDSNDADSDDIDTDALVAALETAERQRNLSSMVQPTNLGASLAAAASIATMPPSSVGGGNDIIPLPSAVSAVESAAQSNSFTPVNSSLSHFPPSPAILAQAQAMGMAVAARSTLTDPAFVETFFAQSRLHFLGSWKKHYETMLPHLLKITPKYRMANSAGATANVSRASFFQSNAGSNPVISTMSNQRVVLHVDMDCFFVSVSIRDEPALENAPVVVCHSKGTRARMNSSENGGGPESEQREGENETTDNPFEEEYNNNHSATSGTVGNSSISSASYAARAKGIGAETSLRKALMLCPELVVKQYDFESYIRVSEEVYRVFFSYTHAVEGVSCDEAYLEFPCGVDGLKIAEDIRREILQRTRCKCSAGVGNNKLLARVATSHAKPNRSFQIMFNPKDSSGGGVTKFLSPLPLKSLQGVGYVLSAKLRSLGLDTCSDLQNSTVTKSWLQSQLGEKTGERLFNCVRGIDPSPLVVARTPGSIGAEVNYGLRFITPSSVHSFIREVSKEVSRRLSVYKLRGYSLMVKAKQRSTGQPMEPTFKFLGHGICDNHSKSMAVRRAISVTPTTIPNLSRTSESDMLLATAVTSAVDVTADRIGNIAIELYSSFGILPHDLRGFGIIIGKLEPESAVHGVSTLSSTSNSHLNDVAEPVAPSNETSAPMIDSLEIPTSIPIVSLQHQQSSAIMVRKLAQNANNSNSGNANVAPTQAASVDINTPDSVVRRLPQTVSPDRHVIVSTFPTYQERDEPAPVVQSTPAENNSATVSSTSTSHPAPFVFDPVIKSQMLREDLSLFPSFALLDKDIIAELPIDIRQELATIYKRKRVVDLENLEQQQQQQQRVQHRSVDPSIRSTSLTESSKQFPIEPSRNGSPSLNVSLTPVSHHHQTPADAESLRLVEASTSAIRSSSTPVINMKSIPTSKPLAAAASSIPSSHLVSEEVEFAWSQLDRSVLAELPPSIQAEIAAEVKRVKHSQLVTLPVMHRGFTSTNSTSGSMAGNNNPATFGKKRKKDDLSTVKVLNIAAHFQQMQKRQRRAATAVAAATTEATLNSHSVVESSNTTAAANLIVIDDDTQVSHPPADQRNLSLGETESDAPFHPEKNSTLPQFDLYPKGFARVDPRAHPKRYQRAALINESEKGIENNNYYEVDDGSETTTAEVGLHNPSDVFLNSMTSGHVDMEIDPPQNFDDSKSKILVNTCNDSILKVPADDVRACDNLQPFSLHPLHTVPEEDEDMHSIEAGRQFPEEHARMNREFTDEITSSKLVVDADEETCESNHSFSEESFATIQPWLSRWVREIATPPHDSHVNLLQQFCHDQLWGSNESHHNHFTAFQSNFDLVQSMLQYLRRIVSDEIKQSLTSSQVDEVPPISPSNLDWTKWVSPFNQLLATIQDDISPLLGGSLDIAPLREGFIQ